MEIKYAERLIKNNIGYGILMTGLGLFLIFMSETRSVFHFVWLLFGALQIGTAWYYKKFPYLSIENNQLTRHSIFPKTIEVDEIRKVRKFVNSYKIETSEKTLTINKNVIEPESLYRLTDYLNARQLKDFAVESGS